MQLAVGVKADVGFQQPDLAGIWHFHIFGDNTGTANDPGWTKVVLTIDESGAASGTWLEETGESGPIGGGTFTLAGNGLVSGNFPGGPQFPHGKLDSSKQMLVLLGRETDSRQIMIGIRGQAVPAPLTVTVGANKASPQPIGTTITFTADADSGAAPYSFKWLTSSDGTTWTVARDWGASETFAWTPDTLGVYGIKVWARSDGSTVDAPEAQASVMGFAITAAVTHTLTVAIAGSSGGSVSGPGIDCGSDCQESYTGGTVTLTASASAGGAFREWRGVLCTGGNSGANCSFTISGDTTVTAVFSKTFTDGTLTGVTVKAVHFAELAEAINTLRSRLATPLPPFPWAVAAPATGGPVRATHVTDLRAALDQIATQSYAEGIIAGTTPIRASHVMELRQKVGGLE
jgi:hypothetical protein